MTVFLTDVWEPSAGPYPTRSYLHNDSGCVAVRLDTGDVYLKQPLSLLGSAEKFFRADEVIEVMVDISCAKPVATPQEGVPVIFSRRTPDQSDLAMPHRRHTFVV